MILVDTSVWLRFVAGRPTYLEQLGGLLSRDQILRHDLVYGELLIGDKGGRRKLLENYRTLQHIETAPHEQVVQLTEGRKLHGRGVNWIDIHLLASALIEKVPLWTVDARLHVLAEELGVAYTVAA